jgi:excisionase family DNA binding protein
VLCYTERTVDRLIAQGILRAYKVPGRSRVLIERASIIALMTEAVA